jgi:hypothetical protein
MKKFSIVMFLVALTSIPGYAEALSETKVQNALSPEDLVMLAFRENIPLPGNVSLIDALQFIVSKMEGSNVESKEFLQELRVQIQQNHENTELLTEILKKIREAFKSNQFVFLGESNIIKKYSKK